MYQALSIVWKSIKVSLTTPVVFLHNPNPDAGGTTRFCAIKYTNCGVFIYLYKFKFYLKIEKKKHVHTAAHRWHLALHCKVAISQHLVTPWVSLVWAYCGQAQCRLWLSVKWSIADLLTTQSSANVSLPFAWITGHAMHSSSRENVIFYITCLKIPQLF